MKNFYQKISKLMSKILSRSKKIGCWILKNYKKIMMIIVIMKNWMNSKGDSMICKIGSTYLKFDFL